MPFQCQAICQDLKQFPYHASIVYHFNAKIWCNPLFTISMPSYLPRFDAISLPCLHCVPFQCQDLMQPIVYHFNAKLFAKIWYNPLFTISLQSHLPRFDTIHCLPFQCHLIWCKILPCLGHLGMLTLIFSIGCVPMVGLRSKYILL